MADISKEIQNFRSARRGKEVRGSMISLAEKVNNESTDAKTAAVKAAADAGSAASNASYAVNQANIAVQNANTAAQNIQTKADRGDFTGTIQIGEVITGEPGSEASANNSGTGKDAVIDLKIPRGYQGVSMRMAGAWTDGTEYVNDTSYIDLVTYQGSTYGCKRTHTASEETVPIHEGNEYWQCIAEKGETGDIENIDTVPIAFEEAEERENIESGDSIPKGFGKIRKWFSDFKQAAYMNVVNGVTQSIEGQAVLDAAVGKYLDEKKFDFSRLVANRNITEPGFAMDGKTLVEWLNELNGNLGTKYSLGFRESINSGADLNNYTTLGSYASKSNSNIIKNSPASAFSLDVEYSLGGGGDYIRQTLKPYSYEGKYYVRYRGYTGAWSEWLSFVLSSDLPQWLNFTDEFGSSWITGMLQSLLQAENYKSFEYSSGASHEGGVVIFKLRNDYYCSGIFIPGTEYANSKRIFIINGIPNVLTSWKYKEII